MYINAQKIQCMGEEPTLNTCGRSRRRSYRISRAAVFFSCLESAFSFSRILFCQLQGCGEAVSLRIGASRPYRSFFSLVNCALGASLKYSTCSRGLPPVSCLCRCLPGGGGEAGVSRVSRRVSVRPFLRLAWRRLPWVTPRQEAPFFFLAVSKCSILSRAYVSC